MNTNKIIYEIYGPGYVAATYNAQIAAEMIEKQFNQKKDGDEAVSKAIADWAKKTHCVYENKTFNFGKIQVTVSTRWCTVQRNKTNLE